MQEFLEKNWKKLIIGGVAATATAFLIYLNQDDGPQKEKQPSSQEEEKKATGSSKNPSTVDDATQAQKGQKSAGSVIVEEKPLSKSYIKDYANKALIRPETADVTADELTKYINVVFDEDTLDIMTISQIFEKAADLSKKEYVKMVYDNRKDRRKVFFSDKKKYTQLIIEFLEDSENLINKCSDDLLSALNIPKELFENSCMALMERGFFQQMMMLQAAIKQRMKEFIPHTSNLTIPEIKPILKYQLGLIKDQHQIFSDLIENLKTNMETVQMIPFGINVILSDYIYEKYGIEEEDQMSAMKDPYALMKDQELHNLLMGSEQAIQNMLAGMGLMAGMGPEMMGGQGMF